MWRVIAVLLVLGVGAGPALLDPCLTGCHEPAAQAAVPTCHGSADPVGTSIASTAGCGHDHTAIDADPPLEWRSSAPRHADHAAVLPDNSAPAPIRLCSSHQTLPPASAARSHVPLRPQLRV